MQHTYRVIEYGFSVINFAKYNYRLIYEANIQSFEHTEGYITLACLFIHDSLL